ncbi:MAG TPA: LysR substrate-binding domain-containing protein [Candidatus Dormibacteraeota bacterium]|nr:LysR substrate-binding domain-containing protein [Candidatus Dormibacteraeota bacterium]
MAQLENYRLKVFRTVAERLSFRKAAEELFLTQPAVTLQIKALEEDLGVRLFDRTFPRVSLTRQGSILFRYAQKLATVAAEAERQVASEEGQISGELRLGVSTTIAQYILPRLLGAFLAEHPRVHLILQGGNTEVVVQFLLQGKVVLGLIEGPSRHRGVRTAPFMEDELVLVARPNFEGDSLTRRQLLESTLLMREQGSGSRRVVEDALERAGLKLRCFKNVLGLDSTETIKSSVEAGLGIGFVSRWSIAKELELGALKVVGAAGIRVKRHLCLACRVGPKPHGPSAAFRDFALARSSLLSDAQIKSPAPAGIP